MLYGLFCRIRSVEYFSMIHGSIVLGQCAIMGGLPNSGLIRNKFTFLISHWTMRASKSYGSIRSGWLSNMTSARFEEDTV